MFHQPGGPPRADINDGGGLAGEAAGWQPPVHYAADSKELDPHGGEGGLQVEKKEREGLVEDTWKACQTEYLNRSQKHECGNWATQFLFWAYINWIFFAVNQSSKHKYMENPRAEA